jgi:hypothetical protein
VVVSKATGRIIRAKTENAFCSTRASPQARKVHPLVERFVHMVKNRQSEQLDEWLKDAKESNLPPMVQLAAGLPGLSGRESGAVNGLEQWTG